MHQFDEKHITAATLTLVQCLMSALKHKGLISEHEFNGIVKSAIILNESPSQGGQINQTNETAALLLRTLYPDADR